MIRCPSLISVRECTIASIFCSARAACSYVSWEIEYVDCDSWDDALQRLADKKIDLVRCPSLISVRECTIASIFCSARAACSSAVLSYSFTFYIEEKKSITVGYFDGYYPFSYEIDGVYHGLAKQVLDEVSVITGLIAVTERGVRLASVYSIKAFQLRVKDQDLCW